MMVKHSGDHLTIHSSRTCFVPAKGGTEKRATFCLHYACRLNSGVRPQMSIHQQLARAQRRSVAIVFLAWLAGFVSTLTQRPQFALAVLCAGIAVMLATLAFFYRASRCPGCHKSLWLHASKIAPFRPFKARLDHCPFCKVSVYESAEA
jgi:hypothetical protein